MVQDERASLIIAAQSLISLMTKEELIQLSKFIEELFLSAPYNLESLIDNQREVSR